MATERPPDPAAVPDDAPGEPLGEVPEHAPAKRRIPRWIVEVVETVVLTLVIFLVVQNLVAQPFEVQQHSMEQTFKEGQYVLVDRLSHLWSPYAPGQVIVFRSPASFDRPEPLIKRVIATGGQRVDIHDGHVYVDGRQLDEPYLFADDEGIAQPTESASAHWDVPDGDLFVMGDHREVSADSRSFGPIPVSSVIGRAMLRYWPLSALGIVQSPTP